MEDSRNIDPFVEEIVEEMVWALTNKNTKISFIRNKRRKIKLIEIRIMDTVGTYLTKDVQKSIRLLIRGMLRRSVWIDIIFPQGPKRARTNKWHRYASYSV